MDTRLEKALEFAQYSTTIQKQRLNLKLRLENMLTYSTGGGTFKITEQLISFVDLLNDRGIDDTVLVDSRGIPVRISNLPIFFDTILSLYIEATNEYLVEFEALKKARTVKAAVGITDK